VSCLSLFVLFLPTAAQAGFPLESTRVEIDILGPVVEVHMEQTFSNTHEEFIEATYVFPLQEDAAVDAMSMRIGGREIRAQIEEKEKAREIYEKNKALGRAVALTEQERANVFTQSVANIPPGESIHVSLHIVQPLSYENGVYRFTLPLVVGPRFVPAGVADADRITPPAIDGDNGHRVDIELFANLGLPLADVRSLAHDADIKLDGETVEISLKGIRATRDFVVEIVLDTDEPLAALMVQEGHFSLLIEPQPLPSDDQVVPRELVFVVDNSCSMSGVPMDMAKQAMHKALSNLRPSDSFQVLKFSESASALSPTSLAATPANIRRGREFVDAMAGMGGTHMLAGIEAALDAPDDGDRQRIVCFMTDGYIGNERQIFAAIGDKLGNARLFSFGIGSSVNRFLLDRMARLGRGHVTYVLLGDSPEGKVDAFYDRIASPVLTDIALDFGEAKVWDVYPKLIPDLFTGSPVRVFGRVEGEVTTVRLTGRTGAGRFEETLEVEAFDEGVAIGSAWARARIRDLEEEQHWGEIEDVKSEITETALAYNILSAYTSFVAYERRIRNTGGTPLRVDQPLSMPDGVDFKRVFGTEISRKHMRPGDPLLTVEAPRDAQQVMAVFPWGELVRMRWDEVREHWYHRFLVPRGVEDGVVHIDILIVLPDGSVERTREELIIDSTAPELVVEARWDRGNTHVSVLPEEPLRSVHVFPIGRPELRVRVDVRALDLAPGEPVEVVLLGQWSEITVVAKDLALNRIQQDHDVECAQ
jgi:Ca-activated chloride channel family protein